MLPFVPPVPAVPAVAASAEAVCGAVAVAPPAHLREYTAALREHSLALKEHARVLTAFMARGSAEPQVGESVSAAAASSGGSSAMVSGRGSGHLACPRELQPLKHALDNALRAHGSVSAEDVLRAAGSTTSVAWCHLRALVVVFYPQEVVRVDGLDMCERNRKISRGAGEDWVKKQQFRTLVCSYGNLQASTLFNNVCRHLHANPQLAERHASRLLADAAVLHRFT